MCLNKNQEIGFDEKNAFSLGLCLRQNIYSWEKHDGFIGEH